MARQFEVTIDTTVAPPCVPALEDQFDTCIGTLVPHIDQPVPAIEDGITLLDVLAVDDLPDKLICQFAGGLLPEKIMAGSENADRPHSLGCCKRVLNTAIAAIQF